MSKPSPTGRLSESKPEFQEFPMPLELKRDPLPRGGEGFSEFAEASPGMWERLERRIMGFRVGEIVLFSALNPAADKTLFTKRLYEERAAYVAEQRQVGQLAIRKAIAAFFASFKR